MGIESDQLVYDYLSRVGDLAQQQQLSSGARMRLVSTLRGEIERQRGTSGADSPAVVRRIIGKLGTPDELVAAAAQSADGTVSLPSPRTAAERAVKSPRPVPRPRRGMLRKDPTRKGAPAPDPAAGEGDPVPDWPSAQAPHMAGLDQAPSGPGAGAPECWRVEPGPLADGVSVPGFVGGVEIPEMLRPPAPPVRPERTEEAAEEDEGEKADEEAEPQESRPRGKPRLRGLRRRKKSAEAPAAAPAEAEASRPRLSHPLLLLAAVLLLAGAFMGSWIALAGGWLLAYSSRKLSRTEAKWVAMGLPGVVVAGALVWLWGRLDGRWGAPIPDSGMGEALAATWPVVVRTAAVASALYLIWRSRRLTG